MSDETDLLREIVRRDIADLEERLMDRIEQHESAINVHTAEIAELKADDSSSESDADPSEEEEEEEEEESSAPKEGSPAAIEDAELEAENEEGGASEEIQREITEINDRIAETHEEEIRPMRMHWLHRPVFKRNN